MFSFFKRKKKTSETTGKPVEPVLETRQPETLEEGVALTPVPDHTLAHERGDAEHVEQNDSNTGKAPSENGPSIEEPPLPEPPVKEPPAPAPVEPPVKEPPPPAPAEPPVKEPPAPAPDEPPVKEPPAPAPAEPTIREVPPPVPAEPSPQAPGQTPPPLTRPSDSVPLSSSVSERDVRSLPEAPPVHVDLSEKAAGARKPIEAVLAPEAASAAQTAAASHATPVSSPSASAVASPTAVASASPQSQAVATAPSAPETTSVTADTPVSTPSPIVPPLVAPAAPATSAAETPRPEKKSWLSRLKDGLSRTGSNISSLFVGVKVDENLFEELETALIMADAGVEATQSLLDKLRNKVKKERIEDAQTVKRALRDLLAEHLTPLEKPFNAGTGQTRVVMIAGVNGAGKTTSIGKLAHHFQAQGHSVLLAAGDTFRAAAREQLIEWGARNNVAVIAQDGGDPAAVAFDAVNAGRARKASIVMVDTAGRLPTQLHLMEELKKIKRVIGKADGEAPHEVLLVVDGNTGQNAISQIKAFDAALTLTGLVVTKLDGTAKGGTLAAVAAGSQGVRPVPVYWIGVGETLQDLQPFVASEFAGALLGD
ncbi:cell division protein FtsY [Advenella kashmirensis W13003]|uniref:Signal recognition particle receptor FtsY n=1 Tax=Advenella kashmirensis W13003 TaxID=1424334 RepID=V8QV54_9BURK|nr:cell division protein FtsY [Advenella kashmirensis W13003]